MGVKIESAWTSAWSGQGGEEESGVGGGGGCLGKERNLKRSSTPSPDARSRLRSRLSSSPGGRGEAGDDGGSRQGAQQLLLVSTINIIGDSARRIRIIILTCIDTNNGRQSASS